MPAALRAALSPGQRMVQEIPTSGQETQDPQLCDWHRDQQGGQGYVKVCPDRAPSWTLRRTHLAFSVALGTMWS